MIASMGGNFESSSLRGRINGRLEPWAVFVGEKGIDQDPACFAGNEPTLMAQVRDVEHRGGANIRAICSVVKARVRVDGC